MQHASTVAERNWRHRLDELMDEFDLGNRGLATLMEPDDPKRRDSVRNQIIGWRKGHMMKLANAERVVAGLNKAAGREVTLGELLVTEPELGRVAGPESLDRLEARVEGVETELRSPHGLLTTILGELRRSDVSGRG